jgi:uncharacterized protein (UPF0332 family)
MRFDEKARENLEAAARLLPDEDGVMDACTNAAGSRAYYAAYLAVADTAQRLGQTFTNGKELYYRHASLPDDAFHWGILDEDRCDDLRWLYDLRIKADYYEDQVNLEEASQALVVARELVLAVLSEEG